MNQYGRITQMPENMFALRADEYARQMARFRLPPIRIQDLVSGDDFLRSLGLEEHKFPLGWAERDAKI